MHFIIIDIKVKEPNLESMMKGKVKYDPPRFMTVSQAADQLLQIIDELQDKNGIC
jgi:diphthine synthase